MDEDMNREPRERLRNILSGDSEEMSPQPEAQTGPQPQARPKPEPRSAAPSPLLARLPHLKQPAEAPPPGDGKKPPPKPKMSVSSKSLSKLPRSKQPAQPPLEQPVVTQTQAVDLQERPFMPRREKYLRAMWTMASVFSMILNVVVIIFLVIAYWAYRDIKVPEGVDMTMVNKLLSGLYSNFEKMDRATIKTVIPVDAQIPLNITVPVQTTTQITLSETVNIPNAQVVINTGGLNINSTARVTLPAGTPLTVNLNFDLPVQNTIPVHLDVPVNIPMAETELHEPFVGLQEVVEPLYCFVDPKASNLDGKVICQ